MTAPARYARTRDTRPTWSLDEDTASRLRTLMARGLGREAIAAELRVGTGSVRDWQRWLGISRPARQGRPERLLPKGKRRCGCGRLCDTRALRCWGCWVQCRERRAS